eukprot:scaffold93778_cov40-Cyclotella_meneghiniana.AAC.4
MALMYLFDRLGYSSDSMEILNRCQRFHCVHSLADILRADGKTIDPVIYTGNKSFDDLESYKDAYNSRREAIFWIFL